MAAPPAFGFELFGKRFFEKPKPPPEPGAQAYAVTLTVAGGDKTVEARVRSVSSLVSQADNPPIGAGGLVARAQGDYARIVNGLYTLGRFGPVVTIRVAGREPSAIPPDANLPEPTPVTITVDPGPVYRFGTIRHGGDAIALPEADLRDLDGFRSGEPALAPLIVRAERALVAAWKAKGYPLAAITSREVVANHPDRRVDVTLVVDAGRQAVFGPVSVTGTERMDPEFVAYATGLEPGRLYSPKEIEKARKRLTRLQVFKSARIVEADSITPQGTLPITVAVAERKRHVVGAGASYSTIDGASLEAYYENRNLFGRAERIRLDARVSGIGGSDYEDFDYFAGATYTRPAIFTPDTDLTLGLAAKQDRTDSYRERSVEARAALIHRFSDQLTAEIALEAERSRVEDAFGPDDYLLFGLPATLTYDGRDEPLDPTSGFYARALADPFYEAHGGTAAFRADIEGRAYFGLDSRDRFVLAGRARIGTILGADRQDVPPDRLFFAGGGGSVRGYAYRNIGPRLDTGEVVGGLSLFEASLELRAKVTDTIGIVPFVDVGQAFDEALPFSSSGDFLSDELKVGAGIGVRYLTPIGPLRLDVAVPLNPEEDDPSVALYVGIGQSF